MIKSTVLPLKQFSSISFLLVLSFGIKAQKAFDEYIQSKSYTDQGVYTDVPSASNADVQVNLFTNSPKYPVRKSLFGQNSVAWQGNIDETSTKYINYKNANYSLLRYPGGNWSNQFFWDGNLPSSVLTDDVVTGVSSLKRGTDPWMLETDEFPDLLNFMGADGIVCVNVGWAFYGTDVDPVATASQYAADWVDYYNNNLGAGIKYWELGNENYGSWQAGYSHANPVMYANACIEFYTKMKAVDPTIEIGVVLYEGEGGLYSDPEGKDWNEQVLPIVKDHMDFIILHQYPHPESNRNDIMEDKIYEARGSIAEVVEIIESQVETYTGKAKDYYPIAVTEYNSRTGVRELSRSNTLFTALFLGEMADHNIGSAMQWSLDNGYDDENGGHGAVAKNDPFMSNGDANSSLYVHYFMNKYFGDTIISSSSSSSEIVVYGTTFSSGEIGAMIVNISENDHVVELDANGTVLSDRYYYHQIKGDESDFDRTLYVNGVGPSNSYTVGVEYCNSNCATATEYEGNGVGGPQNYTSIAPFSTEIGSDINATFNAPAHSVTFMVFKTSSDQCAIPDLGGNQSFCSAASIELDSKLSISNKSFEWRNENDELIGVSNKLMVNKPGAYTVWVDSNSCVVGDEIIITSDLIDVTHDTICEEGTVDLMVNDAGSYNWFVENSGGSAIHNGSTYTTSILETDTFYVENANTTTELTFGKSTQDGTVTNFSDYTSLWKQINVSVEQDLKLESVSVFVNTNSSNVQLNIYESDGTTLVQSYNYNSLASGKQTLSINKLLTGGNTYVMDLEGSDANAVDWQDDNVSNNSLNGYLSFVNFAGWASAKYGFFYDWKISIDNPSPCVRTPVYAVIDATNMACLSVGRDKVENGLVQIYPNPVTNGKLYLKSDIDLNQHKIEFTDVTGRIVELDFGLNGYLDVSAMVSGMYILSVRDLSDNLIYSSKVMIEN